MYLALKTEDHEKKVFLLEDPPFFLSSHDIRVSPIFPIGPSPVKTLPKKSHICFCYLRSPHSAIGRLKAILNEAHKVSELWYSHGLASLIIISSSAENIKTCIDTLADSLSAHEIWTLSDSLIVDVKATLPTAAPPKIVLPEIYNLSPDVQALLHEYFFCITSLLARAAQYHSEYVSTLCGIHEEALNIIDDLHFLTIEGHPLPKHSQFDEKLLANLEADPTSKIQYIQFLVDQILSLNASLCYALTQGYSGIIPILEHDCPIRSFSLLGVGTAFIALTKIYESVNTVFARYPIARLILENFEHDNTYIPIFLNMSNYNMDTWGKHSDMVDNKIVTLQSKEEDKMCHISYFSARFGFRETISSISAAIQALSCGATARWSLLTLTHEFLHAHVRAIMAILCSESNKEDFDILFKIFETIETPNEEKDKISLRKRMSFIVLACCEAISNAKLTAKRIFASEPGENRRQAFSSDQYFLCLKKYYKDINEYIVHTLDFLYFYEASPELYTKVIWLTWSTIPEIQERLPHYLLRTLLAISARLKGDSTERYDAAKKIIEKSFVEILSSDACEHSFIIKKAQALLEDPKNSAAISAEFYGAIRIADMAHFFLHSSFVQRDIKTDDLQVVGPEAAHYTIETGEFGDMDIKSPIAFLVDRTRKRLSAKPEHNFENLLSATCWEFVLLSSASV